MGNNNLFKPVTAVHTLSTTDRSIIVGSGFCSRRIGVLGFVCFALPRNVSGAKASFSGNYARSVVAPQHDEKCDTATSTNHNPLQLP